MFRLVAHRLLTSIPLILVVTFLTFFLNSLAPGDLARTLMQGGGTEEQYQQLRVEMGLDQPVLMQYWRWLSHALTGDLGVSFFTGERVSTLLNRLTTQGFHGVVQIRSIPGRFCTLTGSSGTPVLAADSLPASKCDQTGSPRDDNGSASQRQSVAFANMVSTARQNSGGKIDVQISAGNSDEVATAYPALSDTLTAGEWNRVAAANNRVEVHWQPTH